MHGTNYILVSYMVDVVYKNYRILINNLINYNSKIIVAITSPIWSIIKILICQCELSKKLNYDDLQQGLHSERNKGVVLVLRWGVWTLSFAPEKE